MKKDWSNFPTYLTRKCQPVSKLKGSLPLALFILQGYICASKAKRVRPGHQQWRVSVHAMRSVTSMLSGTVPDCVSYFAQGMAQAIRVLLRGRGKITLFSRKKSRPWKCSVPFIYLFRHRQKKLHNLDYRHHLLSAMSTRCWHLHFLLPRESFSILSNFSSKVLDLKKKKSLVKSRPCLSHIPCSFIYLITGIVKKYFPLNLQERKQDRKLKAHQSLKWTISL